MKLLYCWRCRCEVPMLDEVEYALFVSEAFLKPSAIQRDLRTHEAREVREQARRAALGFYFKTTGFRETNINAVYHHRLSIYGPPCQWCGKPLRTPRAKLCAACGTRITAPAAAE
jgi:hypothetical protein